MEEITDPKIIEKFKKQSSENNVNSFGDEIIDPKIIEKFRNQQEEGIVKKSLGAIQDFFSGTKRTEYPEIPEMSVLNAAPTKGKAALIQAGALINPNQKSQAQIIQSQVPGTKIFKDKFDNPIATLPDGKSFYLNKPGASPQDFLQTTSQILSYIPGYGMAVKFAGKSLLKRALATGLAGGGTSLTQDVATKPLGSENIDIPRAVISTIVPGVFEGAVNPIVSATWKKLIGNPKFITKIDGKITLNEKGKKAAKDAGIDLNNIDDKFIKSFALELEKGVSTKIASVQAGAGKYDFRLSRSQATGDEEGFARLVEASKGSYGGDAQAIAREFFKKQNIDIELSAKSLLDRFKKGQIEKQDLAGAGQGILNAVQKQYQKASDDVVTAYNAIDKDAVFNEGGGNINNLQSSIQSAIKEATDVVDKELTPATIRATQYVNNFYKNIKPQKKKKINVTTLNEFETLRKKISALFPTAKNNTDKKNLTAIINEYDKFYDDAIDNALFSGEQKALDAIKLARSKFSLKQKKFGVNPIKKSGVKIDDRAGKVVVKILNDPDVTPLSTIDYIFGSAQLGQKSGSLSIIKRLKNVFGAEAGEDVSELAARSSDFQSLRTAAFEKMIRDSSRNGVFNPQTFVNQYKTGRQKYNDVLKELYDPDELRLIDDFVKEVRKTFKPRDLVNASNTASGLQRVLSGIGRGLTGIIGFNIASINGLITSRVGYDRIKDLAGEKAAKKLISEELLGGIERQVTAPFVTAAETVGSQELIDRYRKPFNAKQIPQGLANRYSRY
tara:strand:+ start:641 stop:2989 length:2349 start_codon:yes stop_codon:yes gene_type:complete